MASQAIVSKKIEVGMAELAARSQSIIVKDHSSFTEARLIQKDWDTYIANVGFELDEGIRKAKDSYDHLRMQKAKWVDPAKALKEEVRTKADLWAAEEKRLAKIEEDKANAELARKAREQAEAERKVAEAERKVAEAEAAEASVMGFYATEYQKFQRQMVRDRIICRIVLAVCAAVVALSVWWVIYDHLRTQKAKWVDPQGVQGGKF